MAILINGGILTCPFISGTNIMMKPSGRPQKSRRLSEYLEIRLEPAEKKAFKDAADVAGIPLSVWIRERLRQVAIKDLEAIGHPIAFLQCSSEQVE